MLVIKHSKVVYKILQKNIEMNCSSGIFVVVPHITVILVGSAV